MSDQKNTCSIFVLCSTRKLKFKHGIGLILYEPNQNSSLGWDWNQGPTGHCVLLMLQKPLMENVGQFVLLRPKEREKQCKGRSVI